MKDYKLFQQKGWTLDTLDRPWNCTFQEYLEEYWCDETTSPRGVKPRLHVKKLEGVLLDDVFYTDDEWAELLDDGEVHNGQGIEFAKYDVYTWGVGGNNLSLRWDNFGDHFETEEEAYLYILNKWSEAYDSYNSDDPPFFFEKQELEEWISE